MLICLEKDDSGLCRSDLSQQDCIFPVNLLLLLLLLILLASTTANTV